jgi:hypothetical protein
MVREPSFESGDQVFGAGPGIFRLAEEIRQEEVEAEADRERA